MSRHASIKLSSCSHKFTLKHRLRVGDIMRSLCHVTRGQNQMRLFFQTLAEKGLPNSYWVNIFHVSLVGRCTGGLIIALKTWKSQIFMICHL